jgi:hypothetical protein
MKLFNVTELTGSELVNVQGGGYEEISAKNFCLDGKNWFYVDNSPTR